jgi:type 2A phosphatase activator TIP41
LDKLRRPDPILFFDEVDLYEDELGDNGMSLLSIKIRVMPARLLLLSRFFLRLDDVIFRIRDTRVYVEFESGQVIRDFTSMEGLYTTVKEVLGFDALYLQLDGAQAGGFRSIFERCKLGCAEVTGGRTCP